VALWTQIFFEVCAFLPLQQENLDISGIGPCVLWVTTVGAFLWGAARESGAGEPIIRADELNSAVPCVHLLEVRLRRMLTGQDGVEQLPNEPQCIDASRQTPEAGVSPGQTVLRGIG
jgi:hypothetical protein